MNYPVVVLSIRGGITINHYNRSVYGMFCPTILWQLTLSLRATLNISVFSNLFIFISFHFLNWIQVRRVCGSPLSTKTVNKTLERLESCPYLMKIWLFIIYYLCVLNKYWLRLNKVNIKPSDVYDHFQNLGAVILLNRTHVCHVVNLQFILFLGNQRDVLHSVLKWKLL